MDPSSSPPPIPLQVPYTDRREVEALERCLASGKIGGGGPITERVESALCSRFSVESALLVTSCTHALELAFAAHGIGPGDEVIVPSLAHSALATAVLREGASVVFADCFPDRPSLDPADVERRITPRTRAVVVVHYAGIPIAIERMQELCTQRGLLLLEDAAQAFDSRWQGRACGTLGQGGAISFHETKNLSCGEGGVLLLSDPSAAERALRFREMGTNRAAFRAGRTTHYTWLDRGSSFLLSEILAAVLEVQIAKADRILALRRRLFARYTDLLAEAANAGEFRPPEVPEKSEPNAHVFYVLFPDGVQRDRVLAAMRERGILVAPHFESLHLSPFGRELAARRTTDGPPIEHAQSIAARLLRMPLHPRLSDAEQDRVVEVLLALLQGDRSRR